MSHHQAISTCFPAPPYRSPTVGAQRRPRKVRPQKWTVHTGYVRRSESEVALRKLATLADGVDLDRSRPGPEPRTHPRGFALRVHAVLGNLQQQRQSPHPLAEPDAAAVSMSCPVGPRARRAVRVLADRRPRRVLVVRALTRRAFVVAKQDRVVVRRSSTRSPTIRCRWT